MTTIPFLWCYTARGKTLAYYRRHGKTFRIRDAAGNAVTPADPGFGAAYDAIHARFIDEPSGKEKPHPRSLSALIAEFKARDEWAGLAPVTQRAYARRFSMLEAHPATSHGAAHVPALDRVRVLALRKAMLTDEAGKRVPSRANEGMKALNLLVDYAIDLGWRKDNPAKGVPTFSTGDGHRMWTEEDYRRFVDSDVDEPLKRAVVVAYYTGLRIADLVTLPKSARSGGCITATPQKTRRRTGAKAIIPEHPELAAVLDAAPPTDATTLLTDPRGRPWSVRQLQRYMEAATDKLGMDGLSFHGLRKGLTGALAEEGATDAEIEAVVPHSAAMTKYYRAQANQRKLAGAAITKLAGRR